MPEISPGSDTDCNLGSSVKTSILPRETRRDARRGITDRLWNAAALQNAVPPKRPEKRRAIGLYPLFSASKTVPAVNNSGNTVGFSLPGNQIKLNGTAER